MKFKLILILILGINLTSFAQKSTDCDSIKIYNSDFDNVFQSIYQSIDADSILAIRHCSSTNGCDNTFGIICWKKDNQFHFKKIERKNGETKIFDKVNKKLKLHLLSFYDKKIYNTNSKMNPDDILWIDDGSLTLVRFKTKGTCWYINYTHAKENNDIRYKWISKLIMMQLF